MSFGDKIISAGYELIAPEKDVLLNDSEELDEKINDTSLLQESIDKLQEKILLSKNGEERYLLNKQLKELKIINILYKESKKINITNSTKLEINELINGLSSQINLNNNNLNDDADNLKIILNNEKKKLEDTIDIFSPNTIRDLVESSINIVGTNNSGIEEKYDEFYDIATTTYIDLLEETSGNKITIENQERIVKTNGLILNENLDVFYKKLITKLNTVNINLNFDFDITISNKRININLKEIQNRIIKNQKEVNNDIVLEQEKHQNKQAIIKRIKYISENISYEESTEKRMSYIKELFNYKIFDKTMNLLIDNLVINNNSYNNKKHKIFKDIIQDTHIDRKIIIENLKTFILFVIEMESNGNPQAKNTDGSSALGIGQYLVDNGKKGYEKLNEKKEYIEITKEEYIRNKKSRKVRVIRKKSSWGLMLQKNKNKYGGLGIHEIKLIPKDLTKKIKLLPTDLSVIEQINILVLGLSSETKQRDGKKIDEYFIQLLLGNTDKNTNNDAMRIIYSKFHHTKGEKDNQTRDRLNNIWPRYKKQINNQIHKFD